jgi:hypothetical protein
MKNDDLKGALLVVSAALALAAAVCWFMAAIAKVSKDDPASRSRGGITQGDINVWLSVEKQSYWNRWAAALTGLSVLVQAPASFL